MLHVFGHMLFGLVVGIVAKLLMPGQHPGGIIATMLLGIVGAWLGGVIGRALHIYPPGHPAGFLMALLGAAIVLVIYGYLTGPAPLRARNGQGSRQMASNLIACVNANGHDIAPVL